jgi:nicotinamidase-related amidase
MTKRIAFRNVRLIDPANNLDAKGGLLVENGKIADIGPRLFNDADADDPEIVDCKGLVLAPGLIDMRVFTGEPGSEHRETLESASLAAAAGGVTTIVVMPNTDPVIDEPSLVDFIRRRAQATAKVRVVPMAALTKNLAGEVMTEIGLLTDICTRQPNCTGKMVPAISSLLARARKAGVTVVFGTRAPTMSSWLPEVLPAPGDIKIESQAQDRFYNTDLDKTLKAKGITTLILAGWKVSGSVTYTSVAATLRGYTVVVPVDASLDATDYEIAIGLFQILHQHSANAANEALKDRTSTLSRTDLIAFKS